MLHSFICNNNINVQWLLILFMWEWNFISSTKGRIGENRVKREIYGLKREEDRLGNWFWALAWLQRPDYCPLTGHNPGSLLAFLPDVIYWEDIYMKWGWVITSLVGNAVLRRKHQSAFCVWSLGFTQTQWHTQEFFFRGGVQQIQLRTEGRQNGDLGAVAP